MTGSIQNCMNSSSLTLDELKAIAAEIRSSYDLANDAAGRRRWGSMEYCQGLMGDVGDLTKLLMVQNQLRTGNPDRDRIEHELADCLWSILTIAEAVDIDLEHAFLKTMRELALRLKVPVNDAEYGK